MRHCIILICLQVAPETKLLLKGKEQLSNYQQRYKNCAKALQRP